MEYKYDVFISYRRDGGSERAELIKLMLEKNGFNESRIFMDTHSIYSCNFKQRLKEAVFQSKNFILIITKGCFDSIKDKNNDYWLFEIEEAVTLGKKIVPIFFDGINSIDPNLLPDINGVFYHHQYSDAVYLKLMTFLDDEYVDSLNEKSSKKFVTNKTFVYFILVFLLLSATTILLIIIDSQKGQHNIVDFPVSIESKSTEISSPSKEPLTVNIIRKKDGWKVIDTNIYDKKRYETYYSDVDFREFAQEVISKCNDVLKAFDELDDIIPELTGIERIDDKEQWCMYFEKGNRRLISDTVFRAGIQSYLEGFCYEDYKRIYTNQEYSKKIK